MLDPAPGGARPNAQPRLFARGVAAYSCGMLAAGMYFAFNNFTLPLYLSLFTQNAILIGWVSSTRSFEQSIIQPLVGAWSDRTWTRFGRRAPFFLVAMPLAALLMAVNGYLPREPAYVGAVIAAIFLFSLLFNVGIDPYYALLADVAPPEQRGTVSGIAQAFGLAGQVGILVAATLLYSVHPEWIFSLVGLGLVVCFALVAWGVRERREHAPRHESFSRMRIRSPGAVLGYLRDLVREHPDAMKFLGVRFLYQFGINAAVPFTTLFIVTEIGVKGWPEMLAALPFLSSLGLAKLDPQGLSQLIVAVLPLMTGLAAIPAGLLGDRFGKRRVFGLGLLIMGVSAPLAAFASSVPEVIACMMLLGIGDAALIVLYFPYLAEMVPSERIGEFAGLTAAAETGGVFLSVLVAGELVNLDVAGLKYRTVFVLTGAFLMLALGALTLIGRPLAAAFAAAPRRAA